MEFKFDPTEFLKGVFTEKSAKLAISALLVDLLLAAAVIGMLVGSNWRDHWLGPTETWIMGVGSVLGFGVIWFIFYIQTRQDLTDIYTIVRKQISGTWQVKYATHTSYGDLEERVVNCSNTRGCTSKAGDAIYNRAESDLQITSGECCQRCGSSHD
jgi:hypothetical protein